MQVKKQQSDPDREQRTSPKLRKEFIKAVYHHPAYLTSMQSTSCEMQGGMTHKLESRLLGEISTNLDMQMIPLNGRKWRGTKDPLDEGKNDEWKKAVLKLNIQKTTIMASGPITSRRIDGETMETVTDFISVGSKIIADGDCSVKLKHAFSSEENLCQS